ncbi:hypothetical protein V8J88_24950 [Massilia sp. W12]|uniref:hypothetical protein n=1 Tax=Massilia sp. W12 TaxID=3126507 RepID=UPI0030D590C7
MIDVLILRRAADIPAALAILPGLAPGWRALCFDPLVVDHAFFAGIHNIEFFSWPDCPSLELLDGNSHGLARAFEAKLAKLCEPYFPDCDLRGWQHLNLYYLLISLQWYDGLWQRVLSMLQGCRVHLFVCDAPLHYYFNAGLPVLQLEQRLQDLPDTVTELHAYQDDKLDLRQLVPNFPGRLEQSTRPFVLSHLPTCMYDLLYINQQLQASGLAVVNVKARHFDMPVWANQHVELEEFDVLLAQMTPEVATPLQRIEGVLQAELERLLGIWLPEGELRQRQAQYMARTYQAQLLTWVLFTMYLLQTKPICLLLSDHNADFHGPLMSVARNKQVPVLVLPHAKTVARTDFDWPQQIALPHPLQGGPSLDLQQEALPQQCLNYPETRQLRPVRQVRTVGLLLNSHSLNGVYCCPYSQYMEDMRRIMQWCQEQGLSLRVRGKPSYSLVRLMGMHAGLDLTGQINALQGTIQDFVEQTDVCLMYDTPTSGCIEFLRRGAPIFNPVSRALTATEATFASAELIPRADLETILSQVAALLQQPDELERFRQRQFARYDARFTGRPELADCLRKLAP